MTSPNYRVAIVGSGPSGFYAAEALLRSGRAIAVDMFERLPVPFGLVRFGVAPDHPKLKQVIGVFERIARMPGFRFLGGVCVGRDVEIAQLRRGYNAVILATGAELSRPLDIPGASMRGSYLAGEFVGWYNGHPDYCDCAFDLDGEVAVVVGHGNVALDVARILLKTADELRHTDIAAHALEALAASRIREVHIVGRRGPAQTRFTESEVAEFAELADCETTVATEDFIDDEAASGPVGALLALNETSGRSRGAKRRRCRLRFHLTPLAIEGQGRVKRIAFDRLKMDCDLVIASIGRRSQPIPGVPYAADLGVYANDGGRVVADGRPIPGLYVCGWSKRGPSGTIGTNRGCSVATVEAVLTDLAERADGHLDERAALIARLDATVSFAGWTKIDAAETARGALQGKPREKLVSIAALREAAFG